MKQGYVRVMLLLLLVWMLSFACIAAARSLKMTSDTFEVGNYGARGDGVTDDSMAFLRAWQAACSSSGDVKLLVPRGTYFLSPVKFRGPCRNVTTLTFYQEGLLKASTDLSTYVSGNDWVEFAHVNGLKLTGSGTFDGQGSTSWSLNNCHKEKNCKVLPVSIKFMCLNNTIVDGLNSVNPKFFHIGVLRCQNFEGSNINIRAPESSPNTDGIHIERSSNVTIHNAVITTGDDCISIGHTSSNMLLSRIWCGPGHGISIGSLGRYKDEGDVQNITVRDCTISNTQNGVRIKTWENSPNSSAVTNVTFENILMKNVNNPIIIDQSYCPSKLCSSKVPSRVRISDVYFKVINGTSATSVAVNLNCSPGVPCQNIKLEDVLLNYVGEEPSTAVCANANASFYSPMLPLPCN